MKNRKLEISTSTLKEALKISERNGIAKSEYLNCVSNEIKQPMSTLISLINRTKKELNDSEKTKQNINAIDDTAHTLFNSVNELLNISNLDIQTLEINHEPFKLSRVLNDLRQTFSYLCNERNITFSENRYDITENNYYGDSYKLGLLLSNLLTNALKYTENGNTIDLKSTQKPSGDKNYAILEFVVSDTGIGMSKDKLDKVFSNNYNNDSAQNGSGLGLSMTKKYISMMNGNISAISTEGEGTSITVTIPLEICEKDGKQVRVYKSPEEYNFSGKTILIAEDNELNLAILDDVLKTVNFKTMIAKNGREAVYTFNKAQYKDIDVILMDVDMPIMDGYEAANTIRKSKHANSSTIPIIAMSQDVYEDDVEKILNNGFNSHVIKPVDADELYYTLEKYLETSEQT
jgi:signal transduction histidine kinase